MKKPVKLNVQPDLDVAERSDDRRRSAPTASVPEVEEQLMTLHQCTLRVRGVLHLLHEALQSGGGIDRQNVDAVCALVASSEKDLHAMDAAISALVDKHLESLRG